MPRRQRSALDVLFDSVAALPWWVGLVLAFLSFVFFEALSRLRVGASAGGGAMVSLSFIAPLSSILRVAVPMACALAALMSWLRRRDARRLAGQALARSDAAMTDRMDWRDFERLIGEGFRRRGYQALETGRGGPDGGLDLLLTKGGERFLVQCKHWRASAVGVEVVRELYGLMAARGATGGFVVTSGRFSGAASAFASGRNVELIDGSGLRALLDDGRAAQALAGLADEEGKQKPDAVLDAYAPTKAPTCPHCRSPMVRRTASQGRHLGNAFWGCSRFPACRGIVNEE